MLEHILKEAVRQNASDVHIKAGGVPVFRINGVLNRQNLTAVSENAITSFIEQYGACAVNETEADFAAVLTAQEALGFMDICRMAPRHLPLE